MQFLGPDPNLPADEQDFRKKNQRHSFKAALFGSIGMATFFGIISNLMQGVLSPGADGAAETTSVVDKALPVAGLAGMGVLSTYIAQSELTEVKALQDDHLAQRNAMAHKQEEALVEKVTDTMEKVVEKACEEDKAASHPQNQRADGRQWQEVVASEADSRTHSV